MMAKRPPLSKVIEVTTKLPAWISPPGCWVVFTLAAGLKPIGQNGLRAPASIEKLDLFFSLIAALSSAWAQLKAKPTKTRVVSKAFIVSESQSQHSVWPVEIA